MLFGIQVLATESSVLEVRQAGRDTEVFSCPEGRQFDINLRVIKS